MPACKFIVGERLGQDGKRETENVLLSSSTTNGCTDDISHDAEDV
jgi:hypothetical protein